MSKQGTLLDLDAVTNWAAVYRAASETDRRIVDWVRTHPGCTRGDLVTGTGIPGKTLDFRLWELAGRSTGEHAADGLLLGTKTTHGYRYTARAW